jgi:hypothetical protein
MVAEGTKLALHEEIAAALPARLTAEMRVIENRFAAT